ncbi:unnamed protein product [Discosporangium mesarthrocarpum]
MSFNSCLDAGWDVECWFLGLSLQILWIGPAILRGWGKSLSSTCLEQPPQKIALPELNILLECRLVSNSPQKIALPELKILLECRLVSNSPQKIALPGLKILLECRRVFWQLCEQRERSGKVRLGTGQGTASVFQSRVFSVRVCIYFAVNLCNEQNLGRAWV